ncbi:MAG: hypothetical protein FWD88_06305 [Treponema sp.]|nr:hypothetical protein [Treponema sp.]
MPAFISKKLSIALLACTWLVAVALVFLSNHALAGPRLGGVYDFLLGFRSPPPVSHQILLIDTDEVVEPGDVFSVLMTLSEMGAADLLVEVPVLGTRVGTVESGAEFTQRIDGEFYLLARNIHSLFDAIRMGLLGPAESPAYVESLVELAERGRDRLNAAVMRQEEEGAVQMARAAAVFGRAIMAEDLRSHPWAVPEGEIPWHSRPRPDRDGTLRRIAPFVPPESLNLIPSPTGGAPSRGRQPLDGISSATLDDPAFSQGAASGNIAAEHIVLRALRGRWTESTLEIGDAGQVLVNRFEHMGEQSEFRFPLDRNGNILFESPRRGGARQGDFRRIGLDVFREYDRAERTMERLLRYAWNLGLYADVRPERIPLILFEHAEYMKEHLLESPDMETRASWIAARDDYIYSLDEFLYGPSEMILVNGYEITIALMTEEGRGEWEIDGVRHRRNTVIRAFVAMREAHRELLRLREYLARTVDASFCIMGPSTPGGVEMPRSSALFANAMLTGRSITPGQSRNIILWSLAAALIVLTLVHVFGSRAPLAMGLAGGGVCLAAFGIAFIVSGYWIDPVISTVAVLGGALFFSVSRFCIRHFRLLRFYRETKARERWLEFHFEKPKPTAPQKQMPGKGKGQPGS